MTEGIGIRPKYESHAQCCAATGIPLAVIRAAKKGGCAGFVGARLELEPLLRWVFKEDANREDVSKNWNDDLKKYQALREKIKLSKDRNEVVDRGEIVFAMNKGMAVMFNLMDRVFAIELPPDLKGLSEAQIKSRLDVSVESFKSALRSELEPLTKDIETKEEKE